MTDFGTGVFIGLVIALVGLIWSSFIQYSQIKVLGDKLIELQMKHRSLVTTVGQMQKQAEVAETQLQLLALMTEYEFVWVPEQPAKKGYWAIRSK